ncbi:hypothetical protein HS7_04240 [Sulfolobales archaeon HS-7]|nr:hypothetical protein HS7_04240 [Sulfolobales archaeon HS-7]
MKSLLVIILLLGVLAPVLVASSQASGMKYVDYRLLIGDNTNTVNLNANFTSTPSGNLYNNTVYVTASIKIGNFSSSYHFTKSHTSNSSLVEKLITSNLTQLLNQTFSLTNSFKSFPLNISYNISYAPNSTTTVTVESSQYSANIYNLHGLIVASYNGGLMSQTYSGNLTSHLSGQVAVIKVTGTLYSAYLTATLNTYSSSGMNSMMFPSSLNTFSIEVQLVGTNALPVQGNSMMTDEIIIGVPSVLAVVGAVAFLLITKKI